MKNSWKEIYLLTSTNQSQTNHTSPDVFLCIFFKMLSRQSKREASEGTSVTSRIQICHRCPAGRPGYSFIPSLNAESCLREKRVTGVFSAAGHYTDSMPFNSARRAANQSRLPACCSPKCQQSGCRSLLALGALLAPGVLWKDGERQRTRQP